MTIMVEVEKALLSVQNKQSLGDDLHTCNEFERIVAYIDGNHQNMFKDETSTFAI